MHSPLRNLAFLILFLSGVHPTATAQVLQQDSLALVAIYNATDGPNWRNDTGWLSGPVSSWDYLAVEGDRVVGLGLAQLELKGALPAEIGDLTALRSLALEMNQLTGPIPDEIGNLTELEYLSLYRNQLSGPVPASIGNLTKLGDLILWGNQLTSLPEEIGDLVGLTQLNAWENRITNIPSRIGDLINLVTLNMSSNAITTPVPASIGNLTKLSVLDLSYNDAMPGPLPNTLGNLSSLHRLFMFDTGLTGTIPPSLGDIIPLERLDLSRSHLEGSIPASLGNLKLLTDLNLSNNQLTGSIPPELGSMTGLEILLLQNNQLSGPVPAELGNLEKVSMIQLMDNELEGALPSSLASMPKLSYLDIRNNNIEDLANFTATPISGFRILLSGNRLHFDDLQLNAGVNIGQYWPQQEIDVYPTDMGSEWVIACGVGGTGNSYQWFYEDHSGASNNSQTSTLVVSKPVNNRYYCEAKNGQFVDLILTTWLWPESTGGSNQAPTASFTASSQTGSVPLQVAFDATASSDPEGGTLTYAWTFGDGSSGTGVSPSHTYTAAGSYTVTLTVTDLDGATGSATLAITAEGNQQYDYLTGLWLYDIESGYDESTNGHDGSWLGAPAILQDPDYPDHQDLYFDGSSAVRIPDAADLTPAEMTLGMQVRFDDFEGMQVVASHSINGTDNNAGWFIAAIAGEVGLAVVTTSGTVYLTIPGSLLTVQHWHAIGFTIGAGEAKLYLDGVLVDSASAGSVVDPAADLFLGAGGESVTSLGGGLGGFLDDVWIDDEVYTAEELIHEQGIDPAEEPLPADLLAWYPFTGDANERVGGELTPWDQWTTDHTGTAGNALFLPTNWMMYSDIYSVSDTPSESISFGGWFRNDTGPETLSRLVTLGSEASQSGFSIWGPDLPSGFGYQVAINGQGGTTWTDVRSGMLMEAGRWFHVFVTHDGTRMRVYVNGMLVLTGNESHIGPFVARKAGEHLRFGYTQEGAYGDFRLYNRALSSAEVLEIAYESRELTETATVDKSLGGFAFTAQEGGYVFGTNGYGDLAKAELLSLPSGKSEGTLAGVRIWMGHSWNPSPVDIRGDAYLRVWSGNPSSGPQQLLYESAAVHLVTNEKAYTYEDPDQVGPVPIFFALPDVSVPAQFFVAVHFDPYGSDVTKYAIMSGNATGSALPGVWEMWSDGSWANISNAWFGGSDGAHMWLDAVEAVDAVSVAVEEPEDVEVSLPTAVELFPAYPNPFNPTTTIEFDLPVQGPAHVSVIDLLGREVAVLANGVLTAGRHSVMLDASGMASGVYLVRLQSGRTIATRTIVLLK